MSKEKYKGFILEQRSAEVENTYHDFHDGWQGNGTYSTSYWTELTNPRTLQTLTFESIEEAKKWIDNRKLYAKENRALNRKLGTIAKKLKGLEEQAKKLDAKKWELINTNNELYSSKHPEFRK